MRILSAVLLSVILLSGTWGYTKFADSVRREPVDVQPEMDDANWRIRIDRTFDCVPDPAANNVSLNVQLKQEDLFKSEELIKAADDVSIDQVPEVEQGDNELFIFANLTTLDDFEFDLNRQQALRIRIYRGDELIQDASIWSEQGSTSIQETVLFQAPRQIIQHDHEHDLALSSLEQ